MQPQSLTNNDSANRQSWSTYLANLGVPTVCIQTLIQSGFTSKQMLRQLKTPQLIFGMPGIDNYAQALSVHNAVQTIDTPQNPTNIPTEPSQTQTRTAINTPQMQSIYESYMTEGSSNTAISRDITPQTNIDTTDTPLILTNATNTNTSDFSASLPQLSDTISQTDPSQNNVNQSQSMQTFANAQSNTNTSIRNMLSIYKLY